MSRTWFVTGASRGMGRELVEQALARGDRVAATLRRPGTLDDLATRYGDRLWIRQLDIADTAWLRAVVAEAFADHGQAQSLRPQVAEQGRRRSLAQDYLEPGMLGA